MALFVVACTDNDDNGGGGGETVGAGDGCYYVLNSGDWKSNNSSLTKYDPSTGEVWQNYFEQQNGRCLGNTANDVVVYGSKMYIAVAGEGTIEVADLDAKSIKQINCNAQPRYIATYDGKVYVTLYDGFVARIDTLSLEIESKVAVGRNPEQLAVFGGCLYVANSGGMDYNTALGYDKTVSVINLSTFTEEHKLDVVVNPSVVVAADNGVFVASYGNYADIPSTLQYINSNNEVSVVEGCRSMTEFCYLSGELFGYFSQYDEYWNPVYTFPKYDISSGELFSPWIMEAVLPVPYKICAAAGYVCVTSSDYMNDGDVYLYDIDGMLVSKIPAGLNPVKVVSVK